MTRPPSAAADGTGSIDAILARYIAGTAARPLPEPVALRCRLHLLDTLAAILSGRFLPAGVFAYNFVERHPAAAGEAVLLGDRRRTSAEYAAFANAMAAHADETDDSHITGRFHPGCGIVPAAIAVAERAGANADALLKAIALGYDVGARATMALGFSNPKTTVFSTHAFGTLFGAAAAAGSLLKLDPTQTEALLSFTVQQCSGLSYWNRDPHHIEKSFDFGAKSARNGVFAALLAEAGMTAPDHPLTGPNGYLDAFAESPHPERLIDGLGTRWEITHASIKKWPVGSPLQSALDAVGAVFNSRPMPPEVIADIELRLPANRIHVVDGKHMPAVCAQHLVALATLRGKVSFADSHNAALMHNPVVLALRRKVRLVADEALTAACPERQAIIAATLTSGEVYRYHAKAVRGTPDDPMTAEEVAAKAGDILEAILPDRGKTLIDLCLEQNFTIEALTEACLLPGHRGQTCRKETP